MGVSFRHNKLKIFRETLVMVFLIVILKVFVSHLGWEFITPSILLTSGLVGSFFILGTIFSSVYRDYKTVEHIPAHIAVAIESIYQDAIIFKQQHRRFDLFELADLLESILLLFRKDLVTHSKKSYFKTLELSFVFAKLEKLGIPIQSLIKVKSHQHVILEDMLRVNYLQKMQSVPSAIILAQVIVVGFICILLVTKLDALINELVAIGFISLIFIYLLKLIQTLDRPFHAKRRTIDDVNLFQLKELQLRITKDK